MSTDTRPISDRELTATTDAQVWARAFRQRFPIQVRNDDQEHTLLGWFANAIERGRIAGEAGRDQAYRERNEVAAALSSLFPAWLGFDPDEVGWPVVYIALPTGQVSWHIAQADLPLFAHLQTDARPWDEHTREERSARLAALSLAAPPRLRALERIEEIEPRKLRRIADFLDLMDTHLRMLGDALHEPIEPGDEMQHDLREWAIEIEEARATR